MFQEDHSRLLSRGRRLTAVYLLCIPAGLSSMRLTPERSGEYLRPLLDYAASHIPADKHRETSLYIMATAGMRLLSKE